MEHPPFEDVFPIQDGDFPLLCLFTGGYLYPLVNLSLLKQCFFGKWWDLDMLLPCKFSKGKVGYPWERTRDIYQHNTNMYHLYMDSIMVVSANMG